MTPFRGAAWWEWDGFSGEDVRNSAEAFPFLPEGAGAVEGGGLRRSIHLESFGMFWNVPAFHNKIKPLENMRHLQKIKKITPPPL